MPEVNQYLTKKSYVDTELAKKLENNNGTIEAIDSRVVFSKDQNDIAIDYINKEEVRLSDSLTNTKALLSPSGLSFIDSNNNYKTISNITNDFNQQSQTLALSQKGAYDLAATKQDVLTPGANITIAEDQQTGDLVISSTGGGTSVIANPLDQSSADLVKIKIDNVTYDIPGGGGQTYNDFTGATASTAGTHGLVPAPLAGDQDKYLKADGTWAEVAGGGGASTIVEESVQIAGGAPVYQCTHTISDYDMIGFIWEGASEIHWTKIDKTASFDCYLGDISNVNTSTEYALTQGKIIVNPVNNTVKNEYSTMFHYDGSSYKNTYGNRRIVKLYFAKISGASGEISSAKYLKSHGTEYIETDIYVNQDLDYEFDFFLDREQVSVSNWTHLICGQDSNATNSVWIGYKTGYLSFQKGTNKYQDVAKFLSPQYVYSVINQGGRHYLNGDSITNDFGTAAFQSSNKLCIFAGVGGGIAPSNGFCLVRFKVFDSGVLVNDFIPVTDSQNEPCLYDQINNVYYYNKGTGAFEIGNVSDIVTENVGGINEGKINYSTTEQKTGQKWVNGSDIYQKTIELNNYRMSPNTTQTIPHGITDLSQIINYSFTCELTDSYDYTNYGCGGLMTPWSAWANRTNFTFISPSEWDGKTTRTWYITLQYTKTSS